MVSNTNDSGPGSLRAAIAEDDSDEPITFASNLAGQVISLSSGPITISQNLTIAGLGANESQVVSGTVAPIPTDLWAGNGNTNDTSGAAPGYAIGTLSYAPGIVGQAFKLNGTNAVTVPNNLTLDSSSFTIGGWFYLTQAGTYLASKDDGNNHGWLLYTNNSYQPVFQVDARPVGDADHRLDRADAESVVLPRGELRRDQPQPVRQWPARCQRHVARRLRPQLVADGDRWCELDSSTRPAMIEQFAFYSSALTANQVPATYDATLGQSQPAYQGYGIFKVASGVTVSIAGLTLGDGDAVNGGGVDNAGT